MSDEEQRDYLFMRRNPKGLHFERWRCDRGCGKWFHAVRDTVTMEFKAIYGTSELPPSQWMEQLQANGRNFKEKLKARRKIMSNKPYRLAQGGRRIDRAKKVSFSFDGKQLAGFTGDTLASAVMAHGQSLFGRSFKYHRPRGWWASVPRK